MIRALLLSAAVIWINAAYASCDPLARIGKDPSSAWWVRMEFVPCDSEIYGIPVHKIHPSWRAASINRTENIPIPEIQKDRNGISYGALGKLYFELEGDFNRDGRKDRAAVGVYKTKKGEMGRFLLIVTRSDTGLWRPIFLDRLPGEPGFFAMGLDGSTLRIWSCMDCDGMSDLKWNVRKKQFVWKHY